MASQSVLTLLYNNNIKPYKRILLILLIVIIFIIAAFYAYKWFATPFLENAVGGRDVANANNRPTDIQVYFFFANWCPHCKTAKPEWSTFSSTYNGTQLGTANINTIAVDCTDGKDPRIQEYQINGYPTVFAIKDGQRVDYDSKITSDGLTKFLQSM